MAVDNFEAKLGISTSCLLLYLLDFEKNQGTQNITTPPPIRTTRAAPSLVVGLSLDPEGNLMAPRVGQFARKRNNPPQN